MAIPDFQSIFKPLLEYAAVQETVVMTFATRLAVDRLSPEVNAVRIRIAELTAEIAKFDRSAFSVNETPE
jgi:hypothetical protein